MKPMPTNMWQRSIFAMITVIITVLLFVFYNLGFVNGYALDFILAGGVMVFGVPMSLIAIILIEIAFAFTLEMLVASPLSMKLAFKAVPPQENKFVFVETAIICATVCIMCPLMSLVATFLYCDLTAITLWEFLSNWLMTIFRNFPLAFFSQLFFIQPFVRMCYGNIAKIWTNKSIEN